MYFFKHSKKHSEDDYITTSLQIKTLYGTSSTSSGRKVESKSLLFTVQTFKYYIKCFPYGDPEKNKTKQKNPDKSEAAEWIDVVSSLLSWWPWSARISLSPESELFAFWSSLGSVKDVTNLRFYPFLLRHCFVCEYLVGTSVWPFWNRAISLKL